MIQNPRQCCRGFFVYDCVCQSKHEDGDLHSNGKWIGGASAANWNGDRSVIDVRIHNQAKQEKESVSEDKNYGDILIAQGKLKEARDWFRSQNNNTMARILSEIVRSTKGVEMRMASINGYRKSKNREQVSRIIKDIE